MPGIKEWLSSHGLPEYADRFAANRIDLSILPDLSDEDLRELGVLLGDRRRDLIAAVTGLNTRVPQKLRVGIATGVVVGNLAPGIVGETPNRAARLQRIAEPNTVVIGESTRRLLGDLFEFEDLGTKTLKGIAAPVQTWAVLRPSSTTSRFEALHASGMTALVGRQEEGDLLRRHWSQSAKGEGQAVLLCGEPGIGKSRLTAAIVEFLEGERHTRLRYFCSPQQTNSALHPVIGQFERAAGFARDDTPSAKLDKLDVARRLKRALDLIATLPSTPELRREEIKLQVELITPLLHVRGCAAPETRAAVERAHLLIEQSDALGEPPDDPLLLFSVLYGFWVANLVAFNGDVLLELAQQFLALAEKHGAAALLMNGHRLMGLSLLHAGKIEEGEPISIARSSSTIPPSTGALQFCSVRTSARRACPGGRSRGGCLATRRTGSPTPGAPSSSRAPPATRRRWSTC